MACAFSPLWSNPWRLQENRTPRQQLKLGVCRKRSVLKTLGVKLEVTIPRYSVWICACVKKRGQPALVFLCGLLGVELETLIPRYSIWTRACQKG